LVWSNQFHADDVYTDASGCGEGASPCELAIGASPNLFSAAGRDVVGAGSKGGLYRAVDRESGDVVWERQLGPGGPWGGVMAVAAVGSGLIHVSQNQANTSSTLFALDQNNGDIVWTRDFSAPTWGAVTLANGVLYASTRNGIAHAMRADSGELLWDADVGHDAAGGPSVADGTLFVPSGFTGLGTVARPGGRVTAFALF
jgi:polyvinyl alcohol dehydrogenase (cytochrome)